MDAVKEESNGSANAAKTRLRYPLRSASKTKDEKADSASSTTTTTTTSTSKRGKPASTVLNVSGKDKSAKPPMRISAPAKSSISPLPRSTGTITPISGAGTKRAKKGQGSNEKPVRRKFSVLSSVSYWLSQIKLSESTSKHSVSLGFFKLALESGCEPLQRMRDELKVYVRQHNLVELAEPLKELLFSYNISEGVEELQVSETCSHVRGEATQFSEEGVCRSSSINGGKKFKPKSLSPEKVEASSVAESVKRGSAQKSNASKNRGSMTRNSLKFKTVDIGGGNQQKKSQRSNKQVTTKETAKAQPENFVREKVPVESLPAGEPEQDDKENKDNTQQQEEISLTDVVT